MYDGQFTTDLRDMAYPDLWQGTIAAYLPLLGPQNLSLYDWSSNNNTGTLTNPTLATVWQISGGQYAANFLGGTDYISIPTLTLTGQSAISIWFNETNFSTDGRICIGNTASGGEYLNIYATKVNTHTVSQLQSFNIPTISAGVWNHLLVSRDASNLVHLYMNGIESTSGSLSVTEDYVWNGIGRYRTGSGADAPYQWFGFLDDIHAWNRTIVSSDALLLSQLGRGGAYLTKPSLYGPQGNNRRRRLLAAGAI